MINAFSTLERALFINRAYQSDATKKSHQKMYEDAASGDPETQARYERFLATRRENYHRKKQAEVAPTN